MNLDIFQRSQHLKFELCQQTFQSNGRDVLICESKIKPDLDVPEFRPTKEEFKDFKGYIAQLQEICKSVNLSVYAR